MTVDSDVVVLAVNFVQEICLEELWMGFRSGKTSKDITVHHISQLLSPDEHCQTPPPPSSVRSLVMIVSALFRLEKTNSIECTACILGDDGHSHRHYKKKQSSLSMDSHHTRHLERWTVLKYTKNCDSQSVKE